jgi:hypothetical protein
MEMKAPSLVALAKERLSIFELWKSRGWPGKPGKSCKFPDGLDKRASASVFAEGRLLKCFRSGRVFDAPALLAEVEGLPLDAACREFIAIAGLSGADAAPPNPPPPRKSSPEPERIKPKFPPMDAGDREDFEALAKLRRVSPEAVRLSVDRGLVYFADSQEGRTWIVTDSARWLGIARRMDGAAWKCLRGAKARTLRGSWASWPIGCREADGFPAVALVEGGPDLLAMLHFAIEQGATDSVAPICMASSGISFPRETLPHFAGKRARIFFDADESGAAAFERWAKQLKEAGAVVDGFDFEGLKRADGEAVKDLNDLCQLSTESREQWGALLDSYMKFAPAVVGAPPLPDPLKKMTYKDRNTLRAAGLEADPVILRAIELFDARNLALIETQPEEASCQA